MPELTPDKKGVIGKDGKAIYKWVAMGKRDKAWGTMTFFGEFPEEICQREGIILDNYNWDKEKMSCWDLEVYR